MGTIYTFEPLSVPYLQDLIDYVHVQNQLYPNLSPNMQANVDYIKQYAMEIAIDTTFGYYFHVTRFALLSTIYGGFYVRDNKMYWEFAPNNLLRGQLNYGDMPNLNLWTVNTLVSDNYYTNTSLDGYSTREELLSAIALYRGKAITYRLTNCSIATAPSEAVTGETVNASFTFPEGYGIINTSSDIYVTNDGVVIPSTYVDGVLTFTMP